MSRGMLILHWLVRIIFAAAAVGWLWFLFQAITAPAHEPVACRQWRTACFVLMILAGSLAWKRKT